MGKISELINEIANKRTGKGVKNEQIGQAEQRLGLKFAEEYKEYLLTFGALQTDYVELTNLEEGYLDVCDKTEALRKLYKTFPRDYYVAFDIGVDSIVVVQNSQGLVALFEPGCEFSPEYESLSDVLYHIEFELAEGEDA